MGQLQSEIIQKEHLELTDSDGFKRVFMYGWDYNALEPVKVAVDDQGRMQIA